MMHEHGTKPFNHHHLSSQPVEHRVLSQRRVPRQMGTICSLYYQPKEGEALQGHEYSGSW